MKLIRTSTRFVNVDMIESFAIFEHESYCDIVAYSLTYGRDRECYLLGKCTDKNEARERLESLAELLTDGEDGIFDIMHIWESDNDD